MKMGLEGKSVLITGGASGLGRETAYYMVEEGARVGVADVNETAISELVSELQSRGGEAFGVTADVRNYEDCERMAAETKSHFGTVDVLVASAGVGGQNQFFVESEPSDWELMLDVNVRGVMNTNRAVAPMMVAQKSGSIVNIASEAGKVGEKRIAVYSATKGAVMSFTKAFAVEMGRFKVRVNAVCPGVTMTAMTAGYGGPGSERYEAASKLYPLGRLGEAEDIASMITFLASDQSSWVTGQAISVNGGFGRS